LANDRVNVGPRLREQRRRLNLTLDEVARRSGLTKGYISEVERNHASPSVASLLAICDVLTIKIGDLFDSMDSAIIRADQRKPVNLGGSGIKDFLLSPHNHSRLQAIWTEMEPGATTGTQPYALPADEAFVLAVGGRIAIHVNGQSFELGPGDALTYDPRKPHSFCNLSHEQPAQVLFVVTPPPF